MGAGIVAAPADGRNRPDLVIAARRDGPHNGRVGRRIVFVTFPGIIALDLVGPHEVFTAAGEVARRTGGEADAYRVEVVAPEAGVVTTSRGPSFIADRSLHSVRGEIDTLVMVGGEGARHAADDPTFVAGVRRLARRARRVTSVCTGAYVLAAAGLLDGRRATTHWAWCAEFANRFPDVTVDADPIFVRDGNVWTSAGVTAGMDLALALVDDDLGRDVALMTARQLVLFVQRPGGQSQFSAQLGAQVAARQPRLLPSTWRACAWRSPAGCSRAPTTPSTRSRARPASEPPKRFAARSHAGSAPALRNTETASVRPGRADNRKRWSWTSQSCSSTA
jgi:transcriptional regulator GlxA family with amidase domain